MTSDGISVPLVAVPSLATSLSELYSSTSAAPLRNTAVTAYPAASCPAGVSAIDINPQCYDSALFVSLQALQELRLCSGSWAVATSPQSRKSHPALLVASHIPSTHAYSLHDGSSSVALASPLLAYNLEFPQSWAFDPAYDTSYPDQHTATSHPQVAPPTCVILHLKPLLDLAVVKGLDQPNLPVATQVSLVKHTSPQVNPLTLSSSTSHDQGDAVVKALQDYLSAGISVMAPGTTFSVTLPGPPALAGPPGPPSLSHFTVADIQPSAQGPHFIVDVATTAVQLEGGGWRALTPVGTKGFLRSLPSPPTSHLQASTPGSKGCHTAGSAQVSTAASAQHGTTSPAKHSMQTAVLGEDADAPLHPLPHLRGVGGLQPTWRHLAAVLAPLLHPGSVGVEVGVSVLLHGPAGSGRKTASLAAAVALGLKHVPVSCMEVVGSSDADTVAALKAVFERASAFAPCLLLLRDLEELGGGAGGGEAPGQAMSTMKLADELARLMQQYGRREARRNVLSLPHMLAAFRDGSWQERPGLVLVVGVASSREALPAAIGRCFTHYLQVEAPSREQHEQLLLSMLAGAASPSTLQAAASQMAGLLPRDARGVAADAAVIALTGSLTADHFLHGRSTIPGSVPEDGGASVLRGMEGQGQQQDTVTNAAEPGLISSDHVGKALERVRARTATEIGAPQVPSVKWEDIGGLEDVKAAVLDTIELPLKHRELFAAGLKRRSGVLLYGPPGSGKTLLAKAVATQCSASFLSVKGPELINMYVGESERQVREIFARARRARPCVLFFDELDSLAPARGASGDSGGVMDRVVAQLLAEIDGVQGGNGDLFVIGATNRPDLLDPALMRPGRLDTLLYVGIAKEPESKLKVLKALTKKFRLAPDVDMGAVARSCPITLSGADLYALASDAWMLAMKRVIKEAEARGASSCTDGSNNSTQAPPLDVEHLEVQMQDFVEALNNLTPSLSQEELRKYEDLRAHYESRGT